MLVFPRNTPKLTPPPPPPPANNNSKNKINRCGYLQKKVVIRGVIGTNFETFVT